MIKAILLWVLISIVPVLSYNPSGMPAEFKSKAKKVVLTFDDGPSYLYTEKILDILKLKNVKATFFLIGSRMIEDPQIVRRIYLDGHDLGNHTYNHIRLDKFIDQRVDDEIAETNRVYQNIVGFTPKFFRPPGGRTNKLVLETLEHYDLKPIGWTINANDFLYGGQQVDDDYIEKKVASILSLLKRKLKPGAIILMHNGSVVSLAVLPEIISYVTSQGYEFVKLSDVVL